MDWLGTIGWRTEVDDSGAQGGLARLSAETRAVLAALDREEATVKIKADMSDLDRKLIESRKKVQEYEDQLDSLTEAEKDQREELEGLIATETKHQKALKLSRDELNQKYTATENMRKGLNRLDKAYTRVINQSQDLRIAAAREGLEIERLRGRYSKLAAERNKLTTGRKRLELFRTDVEVQRLRTINAEMGLLGERVRSLGGDVNSLDDDVDRNHGTLGRWANSLANVRIHAGFASLTVRQFGIAVATLGPLLIGVVGAASALIGVLAEGIVGAALFGGTALTAFGLATFGIVSALKPAREELSLAMGATEDYTQAIIEHGKHSKEAREAQKDMNEVLENVDPAVASVARRFGALRAEWQRLTAPTRQSFFQTLASGMGALERLTPGFARNINAIADTIEGSLAKAFDRLSGPEVQRNLDRLLGNFDRALPAAIRGTTSLMMALGNVMGSVSRHFGGAGGGFAGWARGLLNASRDTRSLNRWVDDLMDSLSGVTDFLGAGGETLWTFFTSGSDEGLSLLDRMTGGLEDATAWIKDNPDAMSEFFDDAIATAENLWEMISNIGEALISVADATEPIINAFLDITSAVADAVNWLERFDIGGFGVVSGLATLFVGGKLASGIGGLLTGLPLIGGAFSRVGQSIKGTLPAWSTWGNTTAQAGKSGAAFTKTMSPTSGIISRTGSALARGAGAAVSFLGPIGLIAGVGLIAADALGVFDNKVEEMRASAAAASARAQSLSGDFRGLALNARLASLDLASIAPAFRKSGPAATAAAIQLRQQVNTLRSSTEQLAETYKTDVREVLEGFGIDNEDLVKSIRRNGEVTDEWRQKLMDLGNSEEVLNDLDAALKPLTQNLENLKQGQEQLALFTVNARRTIAGLDTISRSAADSIGGLAKAFGKNLVAKAFLKFDDAGAAKKIADISNRLNRLGQGKTVKSILVNSKGDQQALQSLRLLEGFNLRNKRLEIRQSGGESVLKVLADIFGFDLPGKDQVIEGEDRATAVIKAILSIVGAIRDKSFSVVARDAASGVLSGIVSLLGRITSKTVNVHTNYSQSGKVGFAQGGLAGPRYQAGGEFDSASRADGRRGGRYSRPTFLVGEERRPEYVIATNPAYRTQNMHYLRQAAAALGVPMFKKGGKVPKRYRVGAVPEEQVQNDFNKAQDRKSQTAQRLKELEDKKGVSPGKMADAREDKKRAQEQFRIAKRRLAAVKKVNAHIRREQAEIDRDTSRMELFGNTGEGGKFESARESRLDNIEDLLGVLQRAERFAKGTFKIELQDRIAQLLSEHEEVERALPGSASTLTGAEARRLADIQRDIALAALTPTAGDDIIQNKNLQTFWETVLARLQREGAPAESIREAAENLLAARGGGGAGGGGITSQGDLFLGARQELFRNYGSNVMWEGASIAASAAAAGPGGGAGMSITNNWNTPPPDPHTWSKQMAFEAGNIG